MSSTVELVTESVKDSQKREKLVESRNMNLKQKFTYVKDNVTIEPVLCCYLIGIVLYIPALNNMQLEMACRTNAGFNITVCGAVVSATHAEQNFTHQNSEVQQYISDMLSWCIPVQSVVPVILLLFFGTYSDRHGIRKPFLLVPVFGECVGTVCSMICVIFVETWPVEAVGIAQCMPSLFGGPSMVTMIAFACIADVSTPETRTTRMAMVQACLYICAPLTLPFSGALFDAIGYTPSLIIPLLLFVMGLLYGLFVVKEPKQQKGSTNRCDLVRDIANPQHAIDTLTLLTKAKGNQRGNIIFLLVIIYIVATVIGGEEYVFFYFTQHAYGWDYTHYSYFLAAWTTLTSIGLAAGVPILTKIFHLDDIIIIALSFIDKISANVVFITIRSSLGLYIGVIVGVIQDVGSASIRSLSTKYVSEEDTGKMQSLLSIVDAIGYAIAAQIYHQGIYTYTRDTHIQAFLYPGIAMYLLGIIILLWKYFRQSRLSSAQAESGKSDMEMKDKKSGSEL